MTSANNPESVYKLFFTSVPPNIELKFALFSYVLTDLRAAHQSLLVLNSKKLLYYSIIWVTSCYLVYTILDKLEYFPSKIYYLNSYQIKRLPNDKKTFFF